MITGLSFAALDVETANPKRGSICSIGLAIVRDGRRIAAQSWLCRPPAPVDHFEPFQVNIHKITNEMVSGQPTFAQLWPTVLRTIDGLAVVAHNASFDISAVRQACDHSGLELPDWSYGCTKVWAQRRLRHLHNHKLKTVVAALGINLTAHHRADADAVAAADVAVTLARLTGARTLTELARATGTRLGRISPSGVRSCS
ncbi:exonuclease domain-containing protein [Nocardia sp. NPDC058058]|uniref:exonuclease domain-containing protein n=1 Tax=Nocardia sp. NPDC058058 TaxID=3346317 RepID=UPI0036DB3D82